MVHHFGSWTNGLRAAGLPAVTLEHELPRRERIATAIALRAAGETVRSIAEQLGVHLRTAHRYLAAGTCPGCGGPALYGGSCRDCAPRTSPAATADEIVAALRAWNAEHGAPRRENDWSDASPAWRKARRRWPGATIVWRMFGSWNGALAAAGLPTHRYAWARHEVPERLADWARAHGRIPTIADSRADPDLPGLTTCQHLHGSWNAALRAAALTPGHETHRSDERVDAALAEWARWHKRHEQEEASQASSRDWAAREPEPVPSASSIRRRFGGSWNAARLAAGLPAARAGRPPDA